MGVKPIIVSKTVTTAGTRVQLTAANTYATSIYFEALGTNTGNVFVGDSLVTSSLYMTRLTAGSGFQLSVDQGFKSVASPSGGNQINLSSLYFDASANSQVILVSYIQSNGSV